MFWEVLPTYLLYGMTDDEFWNGLPILADIYREKHRLEMEQTNQMLWMQGLYAYEAFGVVISNVFAKKGAKPNEYLKEPHRLTPATEKEKEKEKEKMVEDFRTQLERLGRKFEAKHKREQGGENLDSREP